MADISLSASTHRNGGGGRKRRSLVSRKAKALFMSGVLVVNQLMGLVTPAAAYADDLGDATVEVVAAEETPVVIPEAEPVVEATPVVAEPEPTAEPVAEEAQEQVEVPAAEEPAVAPAADEEQADVALPADEPADTQAEGNVPDAQAPPAEGEEPDEADEPVKPEVPAEIKVVYEVTDLDDEDAAPAIVERMEPVTALAADELNRIDLDTDYVAADRDAKIVEVKAYDRETGVELVGDYSLPEDLSWVKVDDMVDLAGVDVRVKVELAKTPEEDVVEETEPAAEPVPEEAEPNLVAVLAGEPEPAGSRYVTVEYISHGQLTRWRVPAVITEDGEWWAIALVDGVDAVDLWSNSYDYSQEGEWPDMTVVFSDGIAYLPIDTDLDDALISAYLTLYGEPGDGVLAEMIATRSQAQDTGKRAMLKAAPATVGISVAHGGWINGSSWFGKYWRADLGDNAKGVAYCVDYYTHNNTGGPYTFTKRGVAGPKTTYILQHGWPATNTINGRTWTDTQARAITQIALWLVNSGSGWTSQNIDQSVWTTTGMPQAGRALAAAATAYANNGGAGGYGTVYSPPGGNAQQPIVILESEPQTGWIEINKSSSNKAITDGNGCYSLAGAVYGIYSDSACTKKVGELTTNASGYAKSGELEAGDYWVKEITPSKGYALDPSPHKATVPGGETATVNVTEVPKNDPASIWVFKQDVDGAPLAGAQFTIKYYASSSASGTPTRTWVVQTDEDGYARLGNSYKVSGDALYTDSHGRATIPIGTVTIQETKAPEGYYLEGQSEANPDAVAPIHTIRITDTGTVESLSVYNAPTVTDESKPSIGTTAHDAVTGTQVALAGGTASIVDTVSYENLKPGTSYTLTGTVRLKSDGSTITTNTVTFTPSSSSGTQDVTFTFDASALGGSDVVCFESLATATGTVVATHEDINDEGQTIHFPEIGTTLTGDEGTHEVLVEETVTLTDTVEYKNLVPGKTYTVKGELMDKATGESLGITAETTFTPDAADGTVDVTFTFAGVQVEGKTTVAFETVSNEGGEVAVHADIDDDDQTVSFPKIGTTAHDAATGTQEALASGIVTVVDTIAYENLIPGTEYTAKGTLHIVNEDGTDGGEVEGATAEATFTPDAANGTVDVTFEFDATDLAGRDVVAFETVVNAEGKVVATHEDITDEGQTIHFPDGGTTLTGKEGTHEVLAEETVTLTDTIAYENLIPGKTYTVKGELMDKATGESLGITAEATFTPTEKNGTTTITFTFAGAQVEGKTTVAFETVSNEGGEVFVHADIDDDDQTVSFPKVRTQAKDVVTGTQSAAASEKVEIVDTITYENLIPGETYTIKGELHMRGADGSDQGVIATAEATLTPEEAAGTTEVTFAFDGSALAGSTTVVFERLYSADGVLVGEHADIDDGGQTIVFPSLGTKATDKADGDQQVLADSKVTIVDTVSYTGLIPGETYTVSGEIHIRKADGTDAGVLKDRSGNPVTASTTFTAEQPDGTVTVEFAVDTSGLAAGTKLVVFENCQNSNGIDICWHQDITDEGQTVTVVKPGLPSTGEDDVNAIVSVMMMTGLVLMAASEMHRRRTEHALE